MARTCILALCALACTLSVVTAQPTAQPVLPGEPEAFKNATAATLLYRYDLPDDKAPNSTIVANPAPGLPLAKIVTRVFALEPCSLFIPHFHPGSSEFFIGLDGQIEIAAYINGTVVEGTIDDHTNFLVPQNVLHTFYNDQCEQANVQTVLTTGPGFQGFYNVPAKFLKTDITAAGFKALIESGPSDTMLRVGDAFLDLTTKCKKRCRKGRYHSSRKCLRRSYYGQCFKWQSNDYDD